MMTGGSVGGAVCGVRPVCVRRRRHGPAGGCAWLAGAARGLRGALDLGQGRREAVVAPAGWRGRVGALRRSRRTAAAGWRRRTRSATDRPSSCIGGHGLRRPRARWRSPAVRHVGAGAGGRVGVHAQAARPRRRPPPDRRPAPPDRCAGRRRCPRARYGRFPAGSRGRRWPGSAWRSARPAGCRCPGRAPSSRFWNSSLHSSGDRPSDGSSSIRICGFDIIARPMATICCSPPDMVRTTWPLRSISLGNRLWTRSRLAASSSRARAE